MAGTSHSDRDVAFAAAPSRLVATSVASMRARQQLLKFCKSVKSLVGAGRFELPTPCPETRDLCAATRIYGHFLRGSGRPVRLLFTSILRVSCADRLGRHLP
jgi:hypothetical protein